MTEIFQSKILNYDRSMYWLLSFSFYSKKDKKAKDLHKIFPTENKNQWKSWLTIGKNQTWKTEI